uniref:Leucine rich repeat containing 10 n=1 Tax=Eptatretus burgeri TaxID=7764 RepID=A0A8C4Q7E6_EPTBU
MEGGADHMLDLSSRGLRHPPPPLFAFTHLLKLYLSGNRLRTLPEELSQLHCLRILALDSNKLEEVPPPVCALRELCRLYLGSNRLQTLPEDLRHLENLKALWLENNFFRHFPPVLCKLLQLRALQLGDNRLRSLPVGLSAASNLRGLWLYGNRFDEFPKVLCRMDVLEVIDLDRNHIFAFPNLEHLVHLSLLSYDHNPCGGIPQVALGVTLVGDALFFWFVGYRLFTPKCPSPPPLGLTLTSTLQLVFTPAHISFCSSSSMSLNHVSKKTPKERLFSFYYKSLYVARN